MPGPAARQKARFVNGGDPLQDIDRLDGFVVAVEQVMQVKAAPNARVRGNVARQKREARTSHLARLKSATNRCLMNRGGAAASQWKVM